jgi:hypothetical protein
MVDGDLDELVGASEDLVGGILSASGIDPCGRARLLLVDLEPASLGVLEPLLEMHVRSCAACGALHRALIAMRQDLPALAELEPDAEFLADVMAVTVDVPRWRDRWQRLLARPRLALEGAYVGTLILALTFVTPAAAITEIPGRVLQGLRSDSEARRTLAEGWEALTRAGIEGWEAMADRFETYADSAPSLSEARATVEAEISTWRSELTRRWQQLREWLIDPLIERIRALMSATERPTEGRDNEAGAARPDTGVNDDRDDDRRTGADL